MELHITDTKYLNNLDTDKFSKMLDDPTQCYKFYWLEAIMLLTNETTIDIEFNDIINEMIVSAWYTVTRYHLRLGPYNAKGQKNYLENLIEILENYLDIQTKITREELLYTIKNHDKELYDIKKKLVIYVPYRLLTPFIGSVNIQNLESNRTKLINEILIMNQLNPFPYVVINNHGWKKKIRLSPEWRSFMMDNYAVIMSWIQFNKVKFLQDRNPGVPGIVYKLDNHENGVRHLQKARKLWITSRKVVNNKLIDIYSNESIEINEFDLDHFVPWSYVACDELWNLIPVHRSLNSSKGNNLPDWDTYFYRFSKSQYELYNTIFNIKNDEVIRLFKECREQNLKSIWANEKLFIPGNSNEQFINILKENMEPIYKSAKNQGYKIWSFRN